MANKSKFDLVDDRYIYYGEGVVFRVISSNYAGPILDKIREVENSRGSEYALCVLQKLEDDGLRRYLAPATDLDAVKANACRNREQKKDLLGQAYRCPSCSIKFFDMCKENATCPKCNKIKSSCTKAS